VTPQSDLPTRTRAIRILEQDRDRTLELVERLPRDALTTPGLGGGEWSPKDLLGHLASWEEYALDALAAWERGERAPIDELQFTLSINRLNQQNVEGKSSWSLAKVRRDSERTHAELIAAMKQLSDARWRKPATARGRRPLGRRLGGILGGPAGPFRHDAAHHATLSDFAERFVS
jgi:hypothetical protein